MEHTKLKLSTEQYYPWPTDVNLQLSRMNVGLSKLYDTFLLENVRNNSL